ncbi:hypothetical protein [Roseomonas sp. BN140053]|uniref:outer membrane lipoprotein n=1 Tax=Roseomonas sp. BN140053 TaxID=3391898 RepID=UPI0039E83B6C
MSLRTASRCPSGGAVPFLPGWRAVRVFGALLLLAGCSSNYSPDTYATRALQQANKVEQGVVAGVRPVLIAADGSTGATTGAAAGAIVGSQTPGSGLTSAIAGVGGGLIGGLVGTAAERAAGDTTGFEYIVRKPNGELLSVTQRDARPLAIGQKVLVITGNQARVVADYTTAGDPALAGAATPGAAAGLPGDAAAGVAGGTAAPGAAATLPGGASAPGGTAGASPPAGNAVPVPPAVATEPLTPPAAAPAAVPAAPARTEEVST